MVHKFYASKRRRHQKGTVISTVFALVISGLRYLWRLRPAVLQHSTPGGGFDAVMPGILVMALLGSTGGLISSTSSVAVLSASMSS
jgi:hypothetical protein